MSKHLQTDSHIAAQPGWRFVLFDDSGREMLAITLPPQAASLPSAVGLSAVPSPQASPEGWDFSQPWPRLNGVLLNISGKCLELLTALVDAKGPLTVEVLRRKVWPEYLVEEVTIRWTVKKLRGLLKEQVADWEPDDDPIPAAPAGGYVLAIR